MNASKGADRVRTVFSVQGPLVVGFMDSGLRRQEDLGRGHGNVAHQSTSKTFGSRNSKTTVRSLGGPLARLHLEGVRGKGRVRLLIR